MRISLCCTAVGLLILSVGLAFAGRPPSGDIPVVTVLNDSDPISLLPYHIRSDGSGTYSSNSVVSSALIANGYNGLTGELGPGHAELSRNQPFAAGDLRLHRSG